MDDLADIKAVFDELHCCVIMPTYNNAGTIGKVLSEVLEYTGNIIVVNDGSTDKTAKILESFSGIHILDNKKNKGKGYALRKAIRYAHSMGFRYGISIDADGQHFASDLPAFLKKIMEVLGAIIIGSRNLQSENMPAKNSFGNKFSNFWFYIETGRKLPDTQSGFRAYPLYLLHKKRFFGRKYEFEVEVLVRSAWSGIRTIPIPVSVYYPPAGERVSHFRPFSDFFRISVLNTILVFLAFFIIKPLALLKYIKKKNDFRCCYPAKNNCKKSHQ